MNFGDNELNLGINSLSLAVRDITKSIRFYESLGFKAVPDAGSVEEKWLMMENGEVKIGLFQDMFPTNIITYNPDDARKIYNAVSAAGIEVASASESIKDEEGPCNFMIADPDGNTILIDQFE